MATASELRGASREQVQAIARRESSISQQNAEIEKRNAEAQARYDAELAKYNADVKEQKDPQLEIDAYRELQEVVEKNLINMRLSSKLTGKGGGTTISGKDRYLVKQAFEKAGLDAKYGEALLEQGVYRSEEYTTAISQQQQEYQKQLEAQQLPSITQPSKLPPSLQDVINKNLTPGQKELQDVQKKVQSIYQSDVQRYKDLGYTSSQAQKIATESLARGGVSFTPPEIKQIVKPKVDVLRFVKERASISGGNIAMGYNVISNIPAAVPPTVSTSGKWELGTTGSLVSSTYGKVTGDIAKASQYIREKVPSEITTTQQDINVPLYWGGTMVGEPGKQTTSQNIFIPKGTEVKTNIAKDVLGFVPQAVAYTVAGGPLLVGQAVTGAETLKDINKAVEEQKQKSWENYRDTYVPEQGYEKLSKEEYMKDIDKEVRASVKQGAYMDIGIPLVIGGAFGAYKGIKYGTTKQYKVLPTEKPQSMFFEVQTAKELPSGKSVNVGTYKLFTKIPEVKAEVSRPITKMFGFKPKIEVVKKAQVYVAEPLLGLPVIEGQPYVAQVGKIGKYGKVGRLKLLEVSGKQAPATFEELATIPKYEKYLWQKTTTGQKGIIAVGEEEQLGRGYLEAYKYFGKEGKQITRSQLATRLKQISESERANLFIADIGAKPTPRPFPRAIGEVSKMKGIILEVKQIPKVSKPIPEYVVKEDVIKVYHGTSDILLPKILKEGLKPSVKTNIYQGINKPLPFVSTGKIVEQARGFATRAALRKGGKPVVLEINIPYKKANTFLIKSEKLSGIEEVRFKSVPKEMIRVYEKPQIQIQQVKKVPSPIIKPIIKISKPKLSRNILERIQLPQEIPLMVGGKGLTTLPYAATMTYERTELGATQLPGQILTTKTEVITKQEPRVTTIEITKLGNRNLLNLAQVPSQVSRVAEVQIQVPKQIVIQKQVQQQKQVQKSLLRQIQQQVQKQKTITPKAPTMKVLAPSSGGDLFKRLKKITGTKAFKVEVRKKGKFVSIGKPLPLGRALQLGVKETTTTLAQTFRLKPAGETFEQDITFNVPSNVFTRLRRPTSELEWVERRGMTLKKGTGEIPEILKAQKSKQVFFGKSKRRKSFLF